MTTAETTQREGEYEATIRASVSQFASNGAVSFLLERLDTARVETAELRASFRDIIRLGPTCDDCPELYAEDAIPRVVTHETSLFNLPVHLCEEHAPERAESYRRAESKGSGKQPPVVPFVESRATQIARANRGR